MRNLWLGLVVAGAAACSSPAVNFEHQSELEVATRGVALGAAGLDGVAGMFGTTCRINVSDASVGEDYNFPTDEERVVDASILDGDDVVLVLSDVGAHLTVPNDGLGEESYNIGDVVEGQIFNDGLALLIDAADGTRLDYVVGDSAMSVDLPDDMCLAGCSLSVDRNDATTFISNGEDVVRVTDDSIDTIAGDADIAVWDMEAQVLYTALSGDTVLRGLEADGTERWATQLDGAIVSLDNMGPVAQAAVMVEHDTGAGSLLTVDGYTGEVTSSLATPSAANKVETSDNGGTLALILDREVHFFAVRAAP